MLMVAAVLPVAAMNLIARVGRLRGPVIAVEHMLVVAVKAAMLDWLNVRRIGVAVAARIVGRLLVMHPVHRFAAMSVVYHDAAPVIAAIVAAITVIGVAAAPVGASRVTAIAEIILVGIVGVSLLRVRRLIAVRAIAVRVAAFVFVGVLAALRHAVPVKVRVVAVVDPGRRPVDDRPGRRQHIVAVVDIVVPR